MQLDSPQQITLDNGLVRKLKFICYPGTLGNLRGKGRKDTERVGNKFSSRSI